MWVPGSDAAELNIITVDDNHPVLVDVKDVADKNLVIPRTVNGLCSFMRITTEAQVDHFNFVILPVIVEHLSNRHVPSAVHVYKQDPLSFHLHIIPFAFYFRPVKM